MEDIKAVDVMHYPFTPKLQEIFWSGRELKMMMQNIFKGRNPMLQCSTEEFIALMDETGYDKVLISMPKIYSWKEKKLAMDYNIDEVFETMKEYPDRLIGLAPYDPLNIAKSVADIERSVKEYGFKGVYSHTLGQDITPDDRRMYPCYSKCVELGIPLQLQVGHSLELLPSEPGRPIYLDRVALEFPDLTIIASHTGWPWCEELVAMAWKHPNVYMDISAHLPKYLDKSVVTFMTTRGQNKVLFGTNSLGLKLCKGQLMEMEMKDEVKIKILRENAMRVYKL